MKKKVITILSSILLILTSLNLVHAANGVSISSSAYTLNVGQTATITVTAGYENTFSGSASASGAGSGSAEIGVFGGASQRFTVTANSVGNIQVSVSGTSAFDSDPENRVSASAALTITVVDPNAGGGGGSSSGGGTETPVAPVVPEETAEERLAREQREKEEQRERDLKIPLIESISIISEDESRNGKLLTTINSKEETFEYSYNLPIFVNKIGLDVKGTSDDVTFEFEKSHEITDTKEVKIKASNGDIAQEFTLKLNAFSKEENSVEDGFIYDDKELTEAFKSYGFERKEIEVDGKKTSMFSKSDMNLQMIVNDDQEVQFYRLDENGTVLDKGQIVAFENQLLFVLSSVDEELQSKKLYGNSYSSVELPKPEFLEEMDSTLKVKQVASGWEFEEGVVVVALDDTLEKDLYHVVADQPFKSAVVAFDGQTSPVVVYALIASLIALIGVSIAFIVYYLNSKKKIQMLLSRN